MFVDMRMLRIGLLGLGHVGSAVVEALSWHGTLLARRTGRPPALLRIGVRHLHKPRRITVDPALLTADAWQVVRDPRVDVLIEAIGGVEPAGAHRAYARDDDPTHRYPSSVSRGCARQIPRTWKALPPT